MGKLIGDTKGNGDHEEFLQGLQQMYSGTKKWGTVRVTIKRSKCLAIINNRGASKIHFLIITK